MQLRQSSKYQQYELSEAEEQFAKSINSYTFAYIQNKIAAYALAVIEHQFEAGTDKDAYILRQEVLKGQVEVLEELLRELEPVTEQTAQQS